MLCASNWEQDFQQEVVIKYVVFSRDGRRRGIERFVWRGRSGFYEELTNEAEHNVIDHSGGAFLNRL
jgi:hypothetical protein